MPDLRKGTARELLEVTTLLMRSFSAHMRQGEQRLEPAHVGLLAKIGAGPCSLTDLAQHLSVRLPTISRSVALLVRRGWVERSVPAKNRRQTILRLTPDGRRMLTGMRRQAERHVTQLLKPLTAAERAQVQAGLQVLIRVLGTAVQSRAGAVSHE
jgi:DNA-binding MarR family transcriptional regulator